MKPVNSFDYHGYHHQAFKHPNNPLKIDPEILKAWAFVKKKAAKSNNPTATRGGLLNRFCRRFYDGKKGGER